MDLEAARNIATGKRAKPLRDPNELNGYRILLCSSEYIPAAYRKWEGEEEVTLREFLNINLPIGKVFTVAFCYAGTAARGGYVTGRYPIHFLRLDTNMFAAGSPFAEEPEATGRSVLETLNKLDLFQHNALGPLKAS